MKFIKKNILNEGVFKSVEQLKKEREKKSEISNSERLASSYANAVLGKVNGVISNIVRKNHINPFQMANVFSFTTPSSDGPKPEKREVSCRIENDEDGNKTIYIDFDLGGILDRKNDLQEELWVNVPTSLSIRDTFFNSYLNKDKLVKSFSNKIKNAIKKEIMNSSVDPAKKVIYNFILDSKIVLNNIFMYHDRSYSDIAIVIPHTYNGITLSWSSSITHGMIDKTNIESDPASSEGILAYEDTFSKLVKTITFGSNVNFVVKSQRYVALDPPDYGKSTAIELTRVAGVEDIIEQAISTLGFDDKKFIHQANAARKNFEKMSLVQVEYKKSYVFKYDNVNKECKFLETYKPIVRYISIVEDEHKKSELSFRFTYNCVWGQETNDSKLKDVEYWVDDGNKYYMHNIVYQLGNIHSFKEGIIVEDGIKIKEYLEKNVL